MIYQAYMAMASGAALNSEDPHTKVGCILVKNDKILSSGYNHMPDRAFVNFPWNREGILEETKYPFVIHAEMDAVIKCTEDISGGFDAYVTLFPCPDCAKLLIEKGVNRVFYKSDKYYKCPSTIASKLLLDGCGIDYYQVTEDK